jgi:hypothetical protein
MAIIRRLFGIADDTAPGGSSYDELTMGAIPDASIFWPVTGGTFEPNIDRQSREDEVRGRRAASPPMPFRAEPVFTVPVPAYLSVVKKALRKALGGTEAAPAGSAMVGYTHTLPVLGFGSTYLPAVYAQMVRDDLNHKISGGVFNRASLSFPMDGEGTCEYEIRGLYHKHDAAAPPSAVFTGLSTDPLYLRDAQMFIDGAMTAIPDLQGFNFSFTNNVTAKPYAKQNVVTQSIGTPALTRKLWFPQEYKLSAAQDVTYSFNLGNVNVAQELARDYGQVQKFVFEAYGPPITGTSPAANEMLRITIYGGENTGGGAEALTARDDITSSFEGNAFYSDADSADIKVEILDGVAAVTT